MQLVKTFWRSLAKVIVIGGLGQGLNILGPYCQQLLIDRVYPARDVPLMQTFVAVAVAISTALMLMRVMRPYANSLLAADMHSTVSDAFFDHVQHLPIPFFDEHRSGELANRFQDIRSSLRAVIMFVQAVAMNGIYLLLIPPMLFSKHSQLAVIALLNVPISCYLTYKQSVLSYRNAKLNTELTAEVQAFQTEVFSNIRWLKTLTLEKYCYHRFSSMLADLATLQYRIAKTTRFYSMLNGLMRAISVGLCMWIGWRLVIDNRMTLGQLIAFLTYLSYLYKPISDLVTTFSNIQENLVTFERVGECLELPRESQTWAGRLHEENGRPAATGDIELHDVSFGYPQSDGVLEHVNVVFRRGRINALIGPSGSGKTTLLRLLVGFYKPSAGTIKIGGTDISELELCNLRSQISVVWQDAGLLSGSLWENLTFGVTAPSRSCVNHVMELCQLSNFVDSLSEGYATQVGERGVKLSAGQRQRLAIAQALLRDTPVMLFDEATANIDTETEAKLLNRLLSEFRDKLIIFVTHRIGIAALADNVFLCNGGRVEEIAKSDIAVEIDENHIVVRQPAIEGAPYAAAKTGS